MGFLSLFLIMLILIQRGKGGGLTGALGGPGGQSAFGSKAGDTFTAITIVVASLWGLTCVVTMLVLGTDAYSPAIADEPSIQAGPGDEEETASGFGVSPSGGLSGDVIGDAETPAGTSSLELTPADAAGDDAAAQGDATSSDEGAAAEAEPAESSDSAAGDSTEPDTAESTSEN